jgi:uncharacterized protein (DUF1810 family)
MSTYNGWKNRETWNVALWISNDEPLYRAAVAFARSSKSRAPYRHFIECEIASPTTPDGVSWTSRKLDYRRLNEFMRELVS